MIQGSGGVCSFESIAGVPVHFVHGKIRPVLSEQINVQKPADLASNEFGKVRLVFLFSVPLHFRPVAVEESGEGVGRVRAPKGGGEPCYAPKISMFHSFPSPQRWVGSFLSLPCLLLLGASAGALLSGVSISVVASPQRHLRPLLLRQPALRLR